MSNCGVGECLCEAGERICSRLFGYAEQRRLPASPREEAAANDESRLLYENATDNIEFCKTQQWRVLHCQALVYVAVVWIDADYESNRWLLCAFVVLVLVIAILLVVALERSIRAERERRNLVSGGISTAFRVLRSARHDRWTEFGHCCVPWALALLSGLSGVVGLIVLNLAPGTEARLVPDLFSAA